MKFIIVLMAAAIPMLANASYILPVAYKGEPPNCWRENGLKVNQHEHPTFIEGEFFVVLKKNLSEPAVNEIVTTLNSGNTEFRCQKDSENRLNYGSLVAHNLTQDRSRAKSKTETIAKLRYLLKKYPAGMRVTCLTSFVDPFGDDSEKIVSIGPKGERTQRRR